LRAGRTRHGAADRAARRDGRDDRDLRVRDDTRSDRPHRDRHVDEPDASRTVRLA